MSMMGAGGGQIPARRRVDSSPVLIVGFDATHALCVSGDGTFEWIEHRELIAGWRFDEEAGLWQSDVVSQGDLDEAALVESDR